MQDVNALDKKVEALVQELLRQFPAATEQQQESFMHAVHKILSK
jgi:hypothetical protein